MAPCCVYPQLFLEDHGVHRVLKGGRAVASYEEFIQYLKEKGPALQSCFLNFQGRNQAVFGLGSYGGPAQEQAQHVFAATITAKLRLHLQGQRVANSSANAPDRGV